MFGITAGTRESLSPTIRPVARTPPMVVGSLSMDWPKSAWALPVCDMESGFGLVNLMGNSLELTWPTWFG